MPQFHPTILPNKEMSSAILKEKKSFAKLGKNQLSKFFLRKYGFTNASKTFQPNSLNMNMAVL